ncbi:MAG: ABC transporter permease [Cytophagales bacterium]|nr:ABC transporter permease [Cytophagales bacterium]
MRQFITFTRKEFYHILRDRWTMLMLLAFPLIMIILFGFGITTEIKNSKIAVYDPSKDLATQNIIKKLETSEYFILSEYLNSPDQIELIFKEGKIGLMVVFSERFYENLIHTGDAQILLIADGTDPNTASTLTNYASRIIMMYLQELTDIEHLPFQINTEVKLLYNPTLEGAYNIVPGVMGMVLMLICALMTSVSIAREKELGTMEVILVSPMPPLLIVLSKVVPYFTISLINFTNVLILAVFLLGVPVNGSLFTLYLVSIIFIFVALALGLLISSVTNRQLVALLMSAMGLMMPVVMLSGLMFPIENMPLILQGIAQIIPAKWYIEAIRDVMIKGLGPADVIKEIGILSLMAVVLIGASLKKFKIRLE